MRRTGELQERLSMWQKAKEFVAQAEIAGGNVRKLALVQSSDEQRILSITCILPEIEKDALFTSFSGNMHPGTIYRNISALHIPKSYEDTEDNKVEIDRLTRLMRLNALPIIMIGMGRSRTDLPLDRADLYFIRGMSATTALTRLQDHAKRILSASKR